MPFMRVDDITVHYQLDGPRTGPVVLLANSLGTDLHMWDAQVDALAGTRRVLRYDMRGHGLTDTTPDDDPAKATIAQLAHDAEGLLDGLGIARADFVGLSIGGLVAQRLAATRPDRAGALVLCATFNYNPSNDVWNQRIETVRREGTESVAGATMQRWFTPRMHAERPEVVAGFANMVRRTPRAGYAACATAVRDADLREDDSRIRARTLIVAGKDDASAGPQAAAALQGAIAGARTEVVDEAMHIVNAERPDRFNAIVTAFLEGS